MRQLTIDDKETIKCNLKMDELKAQKEEERKNIKKSMFDDQIMKLVANKPSVDGTLLGKLIY